MQTEEMHLLSNANKIRRWAYDDIRHLYKLQQSMEVLIVSVASGEEHMEPQHSDMSVRDPYFWF